MRSWYADLMDDGIINRDHSIDPWSNITDAELKQQKQLEKGVLSERIEKLKKKIEKENTEMRATQDKVKTKLTTMMSKLDQGMKDHLPAYL